MNSIAESADGSDDGIPEEEEQRYRELESELSGIQNRPAVLTEDQKAAALAFLVIGEDGQPRVHHQAYMVPNEADDDIDGDEDDDGDTEGSVSAQPSMSQRLIAELATMKAELPQVHVARDPRFALELGTFVKVYAACRRYASEP